MIILDYNEKKSKFNKQWAINLILVMLNQKKLRKNYLITDIS